LGRALASLLRVRRKGAVTVTDVMERRRLMFGDEDGDSIELWDDDVRIRLDIRQFNEPLARAIVSLAAANDLKLVMARTGRLMPPSYDKVAREIAQSRALRFVLDPGGTLELIGRERG